MKRIASIAFLSVLVASCSGGGVSIPLTGEWRLNHGDDMSWMAPNIDDSAWERFVAPGDVPLGPEGGSFWLRSTIRVPDELSGAEFWLESGKTDCAFDVYADGVYAGSRGGLPPRYYARAQVDSVILIPSSAIHGGSVSIALRCYYSGSESHLPVMRLSDASRAETVVNLFGFFNTKVYLILAVLCLFMGAYFAAGFASKPDDIASLYYALSLALVACYFLDLGSERIMLGGLMQRAVARACLSASLAFTLLFFVKFFGEKGYKAAKIFAAVDIAGFGAGFILARQNEKAMNLIFNVSLLPIFGVIILALVIVARAARRKQKDAMPILFGIVIGVGFGLHDIFYQVTGLDPFAWLQGFTFFSLNLSVFIAMSLRSSMMRGELDEYTRQVSEQRDKQSKLLCEVERAADETSAVSRMLDDEVGAVAEAAERSAEGARTIGASAAAEKATLGQAGTAMNSLLSSIAAVKAELEAEAQGIERNVRDTGTLIAGISRVGDTMDETASFAASLDGLTGAGKDSMERLAGSMEKVGASSKEIRSVVEAVNDFADRTNLLAMNASIEAAHAGSAGRGFAVIAQEIKHLAAASAERSSKIGDIVAGIEAAVSDGVSVSAAVRESLSRISEGAAQTSSRVKEAAAEAARQRSVGEGIASESKALAASAAKMMGEGARQSSLSESAAKGMRDLESSQAAVVESAARIVERNADLASRASALRALAGRARKAAEELVSAMNK